MNKRKGKKSKRPHHKTLKDTHVFRPTTDNWSPNYPDGTVKVRLYARQEFQHNKLHRTLIWIDVWGYDDIGMVKEFETIEEAERCFASLPFIISMQDLSERGFRGA